MVELEDESHHRRKGYQHAATMPLRCRRSFGSSALGLLGIIQVIGTLKPNKAYNQVRELMDTDKDTLTKRGTEPLF